MSDEATPKKYKYQLEAGIFEILLSKSENEFERAKRSFNIDEVGGLTRIDGRIGLENTEIKGSINIDRFDERNICELSCSHSKVKQVYIENSSQNKVNSSIRLYFDNCEVKTFSCKGIVLNHIEFVDCAIHEISMFSTIIDTLNLISSNIKMVRTFRASKINTLSFSESLIDKAIIRDTTIESNIDVLNCHFQEIFFNRASGLSYFYIENSSANSFLLNDCSFQSLEFSSSILGLIDIYKSKIKHFSTQKFVATTISINQSSIETYDANYQTASLVFSKTIITRAMFQNQCHIPTLNWETGNEMEFYFNSYGVINSILFKNSALSSKTFLSFSNSIIHSIIFENFSVLGNLFFRQIHLEKQPFSYIDYNIIKIPEQTNTELGERILQEIKGQYIECQDSYMQELKKHPTIPVIRISNSSLLRTEFSDFPLLEYLFEFNNSKITDCFISGGTIPTDNVHIINAKENSLKWHQQKASFFNQFIKIFEAQGDIYHATQFQSKRAEEQRKVLAFIRKDEKKYFTTTFSDLWILKLNKFSNLHGESWPRAFAFIFGSALLFYLLYLFTVDRLYFGNLKTIDWNLFGYFFQYFNPAHDIRFIDKNLQINGWTVFVDYLGRLFVAYGIYQFIAAFRKHTKKK